MMLRLTFSSFLLASFTCSFTLAQDLSTLEEYLSTDEPLSTLYSLLTTAGLNISGTNSVTLFAPINDAFDKLDPELLATLMKPGWSEHLANVLMMHVSTNGAVASSELMAGDEIVALNSENILIAIENGGNVTVSSPNTNSSVVLEFDSAVVEGFLHEIDQVLLPQFVSTNLLSLAGGDDFTILTELLALTGLAEVVSSGVIATVFAPTDDAFMALGQEALDYYRANVDIVTDLLAGHVISEVVLPTREMEAGQIADETAGGTYLTVSIEEMNGTPVYLINNATISIADVLANNGIIHGIDAVFAVPGTEYPPVSKPTAPSPPTAPSAPTPKSPTATPPTAPSSEAIVRGYIAAFVIAIVGAFVVA